MEVFTRSVVLPLQEKGWECECMYFEYHCYVLCLCVCVCMYYYPTWNKVLSIQECMLFLCTVWDPIFYTSAFEWILDLFLYINIYNIYMCVCVSIYMCEGRLLLGICTSSCSATPPCDPHVHTKPHTCVHTKTHPPTQEDFCQNQ